MPGYYYYYNYYLFTGCLVIIIIIIIVIRMPGYWRRPIARVYSYNLDLGENYYSPMKVRKAFTKFDETW